MPPSTPRQQGRGRAPKRRPRSTTPRSSRGAGTTARPSARGAQRRKTPSREAADRSRWAYIARALVVSLLLVLLALTVTGCAVYAAISRNLPDPDLEKARGRDQSTVILDRSGKQVAKLFAEEDRKDAALGDMPTHLRQAVIATEDKRFYQHEGVDPLGIARALVVDIRSGSAKQGGSTITQQYVKQAFFTSDKTLKRKVQEAILAQRIDSRHSKDEILERYLNTIYFGHGAYGVEAASRVYFNKSVKKLALPQSALLAGVIKSPGRYSPYLEPEAAKNRRDTVLAQMRDQGLIDSAEYTEAVDAPVKVAGLKPRANAAPYFVEWIKEQLVTEFGERAVYRGGLTVETTLDLKMQRAAQAAVKGALDKKGDPSAAIVAVKPGTGEVLAMVGGRDFATQQFNVAVQGRRQPGSAFKPFVLATALEQGVSPEATYESGPTELTVPGGTWKVTGASGSRTGPMRLRPATEKSVNSVFAQLILDVGPDKVVEAAEKLGIDRGIEAVPAIALGGLKHGVSPLRMAEAYATLAAGGMHAESFGITLVKAPDGKVLKEYQPRRERALDAAVAYLTTDILKGVMTRGTGTAARIGRPAAGKTGTTQRYRDAWFVGYTPDVAAAVWVGHPDAQREMTSVHGRRVTGGSFPAEIWRAFMAKALEGTKATEFSRPKGLTRLRVCSETGLAVTPYCPDPVTALMLSASTVESCAVHATPTEIEVPDVAGLSKADALAALQAVGLRARVIEEPTADVAAGVVADQSPSAGSLVKPERVIRLVVSSGTGSNTPPVAAFFPPASVKAGRAVELDGSSSTDDGAITTYYWEFGDGSTQTGMKAQHAWATPGTYDVILWVTDDRGGQGSVTHRVVVR